MKRTTLLLATVSHLLLPLALSAICPAGQYNNALGVCTQCPAPEQFSTGGTTTVCSACAPGTMVSGTSCVQCTAGKFSGIKGSTACQACPSGTGSIAGSSACIRCGDAAARLANGTTPVATSCSSTCTPCVAGRYNDGSAKKCSSCAAGKFSSVIQAVSSATCSPCPAGQTTLPTTTGASACAGCLATNIPAPRSAVHVSIPDTLQCAWKCSPGYTRFNFSEATFTAATYTSIGYTTEQALAIFHNRNDFCCEPSTVRVGTYMCGAYQPACTPACSRTSDGESAPCAPVENAHFIDGGSNRFNRCDDWACNDFFFLDKSTGRCTPQPACADGYTYQRDTAAGAYVAQPSGSFTCVPCSRCIDGSEVATPCTRINDTACRICSPTEFSYQGGACSAAVPFGFSPVRIRLTAIPVFQGRPATFYDSLTPVPWSGVDFTQGFFLNSYTPCQPAASVALMFIGGDEACNRLDTSPPTMCALPLCKTQCRPWNGTDGWYKLKTGECYRCAHDPACSGVQYTDMTTCGPATAPRCADCPTIPLPNALGWANPGRAQLPGPYPCDIVCRDGFERSANYSCVPCAHLPNNSKITGGGCNWTCSLGFVQDRSSCIPCVGVPASCSTGYFLGYAAVTSQCARCLPCTNLVANSIYVSSGQPNGPNTCGIQCVARTFVSPGYGFDSFNNPVACDRCSTPVCDAGNTYLRPCTYLSDAECVPCARCPVGSTTLTPCTVTADTTCTPCSPSLLPANASWTAGCTQWACDRGFVRNPNTSTCLKCKLPSDCLASDSYEEEDEGDAACGRCVPCDLYLLLPGQCFNGDGQCGVSYWCDGMVTAADLSTTPPPPPQDLLPSTVQQAAALGTGEGNDSAAQDPATTVSQETPAVASVAYYASVASLVLNASVDALTPALIADLNAQVSVSCACEAGVVAVTHDNITTFCTSEGCGGGVGRRGALHHSTRRLLSDSPIMIVTVEIILLSSAPLTHVPQQPQSDLLLLAWTAYECQPISDPVLIHDRRRLAVYFKRTGRPWVMVDPTAESWQQYYLVLGIIVIVFLLILAGGGGTTYYYYYYYNDHVHHHHYSQQRAATASQVKKCPYGKYEAAERELLLPREWAP